MKKQYTVTFQEYNSYADTSKAVQEIFKRAFNSRKLAYAPYSNFKVGCALLLENESIVSGSNQENASFPVGLCAERVALGAAAAEYPNETIKTACIVAGKDMNNDRAIAPCGVCRQALLEYEIRQQSPIEVYFMGTKGKVIHFNSVKDMLPFSFDANVLI